MTRDDIIRFGEQANEVADRKIKMRGEYHPDWHEVRDEAFANLVAAAEREACLAILRDMEGKKWHTAIHGGEMKGVSLHDAYAAIRARGEA